ncbi:hypothetical protein RRG08_021450 [Elysia crispata]|uniref:Uncharacterized protein n=1 Tax=Elysia crispata TaxID=231223 RepID=A0AAE0XMC4_9GAST|nr:hypothetical protein RRG08_021450 [Elysia crispata]
MTSQNYAGVGHGLAEDFLQTEATHSKLRATILLTCPSRREAPALYTVRFIVLERDNHTPLDSSPAPCGTGEALGQLY